MEWKGKAQEAEGEGRRRKDREVTGWHWEVAGRLGGCPYGRVRRRKRDSDGRYVP